jgi:ornithine--oxo-acid transaminase
MSTSREIIEQTEKFGSQNYRPLPLVVTRGEGVWVWDIEGKKYMDMLSAYSALSHGHRHPKVIAALKAQAEKLTLTSRAFYNDQLGAMCEQLVKLTGLPRILPMNTGAEAVETALKAARKWGHECKGITEGAAEIVVCRDNFHGRTISLVTFSSEEAYRKGFGPFTPGFRMIDYGDAKALERAISPTTAAFLVEPIQGEAGIKIPPEGFLAQARRICDQSNVLLLADEVQTGFGRTGKMFCCEYEQVKPDVLIMGKALGGGVYPVSAIAATDEVMRVFQPGTHGSTFGGNPLAAAVARAALSALVDEGLVQRSFDLGLHLLERLRRVQSRHVKEIRGRGLFVGIDLKPEAGGARRFCEALMQKGVLCKETHESVIRLAPPLVIEKNDLDWAVEQVGEVLTTI